MASINKLPLLAFERILLYATRTDLFDWIHVFPRVCHYWENNMHHLWSKARMLHYDYYLSRFQFRVFLSPETNPLELLVKDGTSVATAFEYIASRCRKLTKLTLDLESVKGLSILNSEEPAELENLCANFDSSQFIGSFVNLVNLREIEIVNLCREEDVKLLANSVLCLLKNLRQVSFGIPRLASVERLYFLSELHELETVTLDVKGDYFSELIDIFTMCSDKLRNVSLVCRVDSALNVELCRNAMLQLAKKQIRSLHLNVFNPRSLSPLPEFAEIFCTVVEFNNLKELTLIHADVSRDEYTMVLQRLGLVKLEIVIATNLYDKFFNSFPVGMQMLEHLSIRRSFDGSRPSLHSLAEFLVKCQRLEKFFVDNDLLSGPAVNFFRLFHAKFHVCGKNSSKVKVDSALDITLEGFHANSLMFFIDNLKNENVCSVKILKNVGYNVCLNTIFSIRFVKHCQSD